jgi:xanthine/uracil/vitamin C permease (AzgA family)
LQQEVRRSLITATAATSLMATALMGAFANMPLSVAPGMGKAFVLGVLEMFVSVGG